MKPIEVDCRVVIIGGDVEENLGREATVVFKCCPPEAGIYDWLIESEEGLLGFDRKELAFGIVRKVKDKCLYVRTQHIRRIDDWEEDEEEEEELAIDKMFGE